MKKNFLSFMSTMLLMMLFTLQLGADPSNPSGSATVRLPGHLLKEAMNDSILLKNVDASSDIPLTFTLPLRDKETLEALVQRMYDPNDNEFYGKYLSSEEFNQRFAPTEEDYNKVIDYANDLGLTVTGTHSNRTLLNVTGSAISVEKGFNIRLAQYKASNGRKFHAPNKNPEVPVSVASLINGVVGLDNYAVWHSYNHKKETANDYLDSNVTGNVYPSGPGGGFAPSDIQKAYNLTGVTANGSGQSIALFELGGYLASDITHYTTQFGLPAAKLVNVLVDGGSAAGANPEVTLDIEVALALAPQSQIYVYEGPNSNQGVLDTYNKIATDNIAKQVSTSWGLGENFVTNQYLQAENAIFVQMAAHGQTIYAAAGDSGAYDDYAQNGSQALVVDDPASQPYVVGVGGTHLNVNHTTGAYVSESVWNNGLGNGAGGGGVSSIWPIPSWQANIANVYSKTNRNVPDVALNADPNTGYAIYFNGQWVIYGGTSCAAPLWAAFTALVNQERAATHLSTLGYANPILYSLGTGAPYAADFHDITSGNNLFYNAGTGYDNATGLGSFNGANLFASLTNQSVTPPTPPPPPPPPVLSPVLNISLTPSTTFRKGKTGSYIINVLNHGNGPTSGTVTVSITLPKTLSVQSFSGAGWTFNRNTLTFTENAVLKAGSSYPQITLNVNISGFAPSTVTTSATVSGGRSASSTVSSQTSIH